MVADPSLESIAEIDFKGETASRLQIQFVSNEDNHSVKVTGIKVGIRKSRCKFF